MSVRLGFSRGSDALLAGAADKKSRWGDVLLGMALGPDFASCSPTYFLILATVLPERFGIGLLYLVAYAAGLSLFLLLIALLGQRLIRRIRWAADPRGWFKRGLGGLFLVVGVLIFTGKFKQIEIFFITHGYLNVSKYEIQLLQKSGLE